LRFPRQPASASFFDFDAAARLSLLYEVGTEAASGQGPKAGAAIFMAHCLTGKDMTLTEKGKSATERTDFERVRVRNLLQEEMLHPLLQGRIFGYFAADDLGTAVFEAFKTVEIEVHSAGAYPEKEMGKTLMFKAFAVGGPLSKPTDDKQDCDALSGLFAGALSRFRNPGAHTNRTFSDVLEAMEELMLASRLLRTLDDRRPT
jgi:uncharacterized protein (TIGR02391 family)